MKCALATVSVVVVGVTTGMGPTTASAPPPDPEVVRELEFAAWAATNGVVFHRLACDVTEGEGDVCFMLYGGDVTAYTPTEDGTGWQEYGPAGSAPTTVSVAVQPLVDQSVYYSNCSEARDAGDTPLYTGDPGYRPALDRDGDGVACE